MAWSPVPAWRRCRRTRDDVGAPVDGPGRRPSANHGNARLCRRARTCVYRGCGGKRMLTSRDPEPKASSSMCWATH